MEMKHHFWDRMPYTAYSRALLRQNHTSSFAQKFCSTSRQSEQCILTVFFLLAFTSFSSYRQAFLFQEAALRVPDTPSFKKSPVNMKYTADWPDEWIVQMLSLPQNSLERQSVMQLSIRLLLECSAEIQVCTPGFKEIEFWHAALQRSQLFLWFQQNCFISWPYRPLSYVKIS